MNKIVEIFDKIIDTRIVTNGENNFYLIDERKVLALRELLKKEFEGN